MRGKNNNWLKNSGMGSVVEDEFSRDAAEGFAMFPSAGSKIGLLGLKFNLLLIKKAWIMLTLPAKIMIASAIVSITGVVIITTSAAPDIFQGESQYPNISHFSRMDSTLVQIVPSDTVINNNTEQSTHSNNPELAQAKEDIDAIMSDPEMVELIGYSPICQATTSTTIVTSYPTPIYWVGAYKIIDYSKLRNDASRMTDLPLGGLDAKYENQNMISGDDEFVTRDTIPYIAYVSSALSNIKAGEYHESINKWGIVLSQYPDDENALFYIAYSHFLSKNYQKALQYFYKAEAGYFQVFDEESMWFIAQSLVELKNFDEAKRILYSIIDNNSFYSHQANKILEQLP